MTQRDSPPLVSCPDPPSSRKASRGSGHGTSPRLGGRGIGQAQVQIKTPICTVVMWKQLHALFPLDKFCWQNFEKNEVK